MDEKKKLLGNFFKLNVARKKEFSPRRRRQNGSLNHVLLKNNFPREKGIKLFLKEKGNSPSPFSLEEKAT